LPPGLGSRELQFAFLESRGAAVALSPGFQPGVEEPHLSPDCPVWATDVIGRPPQFRFDEDTRYHALTHVAKTRRPSRGFIRPRPPSLLAVMRRR